MGEYYQGAHYQDQKEGGIQDSIYCSYLTIYWIFQNWYWWRGSRNGKGAQVTTTTLSKIGIIKVNDEKWICKADYESSNEQPAEAEEEEDDEDEEDDNAADADEPMANVPQSGYE